MKQISLTNLPKGATMAHIMVELGIFPSLTQAKKNGWDKPIKLGVQTVTSKKILVEIIDTPLEIIYKTRPDLTPGFWVDRVNEANKPNHRNNVAAAIQFPLDDKWANRVMNARLKDDGIFKS